MITYQVSRPNTLPLPRIRGTLSTLHYPVAVETKLDGEFQWVVKERGKPVYLINKYGRVRYDMPVTNHLDCQLPNGTILLGELYWQTGKDFYEYLRNKTDPNMNLALFDVIAWNGTDRRTMQYSARRNILECEIVGALDIRGGTVAPVHMEIADGRAEAELLAKGLIDNGYEGAVIKSVNSMLANGDNLSQCKVKKELEVDLQVHEVVQGIASVELTHWNSGFVGSTGGFPQSVGRVSTGGRTLEVGQVWRVRCNGLITTEGSDRVRLRHPRLVELTDKNIPDNVFLVAQQVLGLVETRGGE